MIRILILFFCVVVFTETYAQKRNKKQKVKNDTVALSLFLKKISKEPTTDKIEKVTPNMGLKTLTLYYDPKSNVSIVGSDLSKHNH